MDFATVRKKLANGSYTTLELFEVCIHILVLPGLCIQYYYSGLSDMGLLYNVVVRKSSVVVKHSQSWLKEASFCLTAHSPLSRL